MSSYTLGKCGEILQVLEAEASKKPMMLPEGISITKGGMVNMTTFNEPVHEEMPLLGGMTQFVGYASNIIVTKIGKF